MTEKIDVFLLAAGEANRMYPLNQIIEKSLLPVDGKPVIRHIYDKIKFKWVNDILVYGKIVICCLRKFRKQFEHEFRDDDYIEIIDFEKPIGTFNTFFLASNQKRSEWVMIHYADCLTDIDYCNFISKIDDKSDGLIAVTNTVKHDYSEVSFTTDGLVQDFVEKPKVMNYSWSGIGLFNTERLRLNYNRKYEGTDFAFDIFPQMIKKGKLKAYPYNGYWYDVGNLNSYRKICEKFQNNGENK